MTTNNQGVGTRELALMILLEIERGEKSHIVLRQVLEKYQYLSKQDRAFLTRLAEGTTERRIELDYIINQFSKVKTRKNETGDPQYPALCGLSDQIHGSGSGFGSMQ